MVLVDTNVLLDIATDDPVWGQWSVGAVERAAAVGPIFINEAIYAEFSVRFAEVEQLDAFIAAAGLEFVRCPKRALFLAGKVFTNYRRQRGTKTGVLPDFFIGAHAAIVDVPLLTRDKGRYRTYFPTVRLISPE